MSKSIGILSNLNILSRKDSDDETAGRVKYVLESDGRTANTFVAGGT